MERGYVYTPLPRTTPCALPRVHVSDGVGALQGGVLAQVPLVEVAHVRLWGVSHTRGRGGEGMGGVVRLRVCTYILQEYMCYIWKK